jgi:hypothetical protein
MATEALLASELTLKINTGTEGAPTYTEIKGLDTITAFDNDDVKTDMSTRTSVDADGHQVKESLIARRGRTISFTGKYLMDPDTDERDEGQEEFEDAAKATGRDSRKMFQFLFPDDSTASFYGTCSLTGGGGDKDDAYAWSGEIEVSGGVTWA